MLGISSWEFAMIAVVALLVFGPDKLPKVIADVGRILRQIRRMANDARSEVTRELGPEFRDIGLDDLNPRSFVRKHLWEDDELDPRPGSDAAPGRRATNGRAAERRATAARPSRSSGAASSGAAPAPFDVDAT